MDTPLTERAYNLALKMVPNIVKAFSDQEVLYYEKHLGEISECIDRGFVDLPTKFELLKDLGIITVPDTYDHNTYLAGFRLQNRPELYEYAPEINDLAFRNPSRVLMPGDKLRVRAFKQVLGKKTATSEERLAFLKEQEAVYLGAQGAALVYEKKREMLPKEYRYYSFDQKDRLRQDPEDSQPQVPYFYLAECVRDNGFYLQPFNRMKGRAFLCFNEVA